MTIDLEAMLRVQSLLEDVRSAAASSDSRVAQAREGLRRASQAARDFSLNLREERDRKAFQELVQPHLKAALQAVDVSD